MGLGHIYIYIWGKCYRQIHMGDGVGAYIVGQGWGRIIQGGKAKAKSEARTTECYNIFSLATRLWNKYPQSKLTFVFVSDNDCIHFFACLFIGWYHNTSKEPTFSDVVRKEEFIIGKLIILLRKKKVFSSSSREFHVPLTLVRHLMNYYLFES